MQMVCNLREFKEFIDNEMIIILGQMDSPTEIFEHVFLVRKEPKFLPLFAYNFVRTYSQFSIKLILYVHTLILCGAVLSSGLWVERI